jgi:hypothetical protein
MNFAQRTSELSETQNLLAEALQQQSFGHEAKSENDAPHRALRF